MKKLFKEFKDFAVTGDLVAVGVALVMALALAAVINALVENVLMPIVGIIFGEPSFDNLTLTINDSVILYGTFITAVVTFVAIALAVFFFIVRPYQKYQARRAAGQEPEPEAGPPEDVALLREIRDALKSS